MTIRETMEAREEKVLSPYASLSKNTMGRDRYEKSCDIRPVYQRDRDRILHCKSFRRLKHKTQVFLAPVGDHYRTRLTHTLEVSQIARTISKALCLNEELTEAIALGHDLGHTPFGHAGEFALDKVSSHGFSHCDQSIRIVEVLEKEGRGLNLTKEVRDAILNHRTSGAPSTLEGKVVRLSDKIAYLNHDIDDAIRAGILTEEDLPEELSVILGSSVRERLNTLIHNIILNSLDKPDILMSKEVEQAMNNLRQFMFNQVYLSKPSIKEDEKAKEVVTSLYYHFLEHPEEMTGEFKPADKTTPGQEEQAVCDYVAGMSDGYAIAVFTDIFVPKAWST